MPRIAFNPIFDSAGLVALVGLALLALLALPPLFTGATRPRRRMLIALRIGVIVLLLAAMLRPALIRTEKEEVTSTVAVLLDTSRSMQIEDVGDESRYAAMRTTAERCVSLANAASESLEFEFFTFDADMQSLVPDNGELPLADEPVGRETDIGKALDQVLQRTKSQRLGAVILMSDGAVRAFHPVVDLRRIADELGRQGTALFPITFGRSRDQSESRDLAIANLPDQLDVFAKNKVPIKATLQVSGYLRRAIPVSVEIERPDADVETLGPITLTAKEDGEVLDIDFAYAPDIPGQYKITLQAAVQDDEPVTSNNRMSAYLNVREGGLRVLFLCGNLGWQEQKFIRRSLAASEDIDVEFRWIDTRRRQSWPADLGSSFKDASYDVLLIQDVPAAALGKQQSRALASMTREGKGLMMLGGKFSFGPGNYSETALSDALPIKMSRLERQDFGADYRADMHLPGTVQLIPRRSHFVTSIGPDGDATWTRLPPLQGANRFSNLAPTGRVLLESTRGDSMLVGHEYGLGRVLAFAGDSTYRWYRSGFEDEHKRFWRQAVLWLARKDDASQQRISVAMDQRRYPAGAEPSFTVKVEGSDAASGNTVRAFVASPDGRRTSVALVQKSDGTFSGTADSITAPGEYRVEARLMEDERIVGKADLPFQILDDDIELSDPAANPNQMAQLAEITRDNGGRAAVPEDLARVIAEIEQQAEGATTNVESKWQLTDTPWDAWSMFLVMVGLLSTDWYCRKKWHMV